MARSLARSEIAACAIGVACSMNLSPAAIASFASRATARAFC